MAYIEERNTFYKPVAQAPCPQNDQMRKIPGLSYIPDKIEVAEDRWLMSKLSNQILDFVTLLTQLLDLMHAVKTKHLRSKNPLSYPTIRELLTVEGKGPLMKNFDKNLTDLPPVLSPSIEAVFKAQGFQPVMKRPGHGKQIKEKIITRRTFPFVNDLVEITGKKSRPVWQSVLTEKPEELNIMQNLRRKKERLQRDSTDANVMLKCQMNKSISRNKSETTLFTIKFIITEKGDELNSTNPKIQRELEMMLASHVGFKTVEEHKAYLETLESHWFSNFLADATKLGVVTCKAHIDAFQALAKYYDMNYNSLPFAKAKLCFIVMSLPFWDIAREATQKAIEFILENILLLPEKPLKEWLRVRGVPYIILPVYTAEDFMIPIDDRSKDDGSIERIIRNDTMISEGPSSTSDLGF